MESASGTPTKDEIVSLVVERLRSSDKPSDLANANLMTIEEQTNEYIVQLTRLVGHAPLSRRLYRA